MDAYDRNILKWLQGDGRMSNVELAERIHLSAPQTLRRVRTLEESGVIRRYAALVAPAAVGLEVTAFVSLSLDREQFRNVREVERNVIAFPEVIECHIISGDSDYLLKVVAASLKSLSVFLTDRLMQVPGVAGVRSMICMEEVKPQSSLPT
ncbi:Lrp/AsnC family transcriptional regulator [Polaromonas jejuensis]|uniref:Lrp/AsnC family transcriptional regulator n=1 Tax=Polaromonas jejuensis TaxID=457502 RepID=A0ABW0QDN1_9BURK|nr:Lrp/AsnC family transcriptional regulator [Polaromonas jejuensis]